MADRVKIFSTKLDPKGLEGEVNQWIDENKTKNVVSISSSPVGNDQSGFIYSITIHYSDDAENERVVERIAVSIVVDYMVAGRHYSNFVENVSEQGVFIRTKDPFEIGQEIMITFSLPGLEKPLKVAGEIVRSMPVGIGVQFKKGTQVQKDVCRVLVRKIKGRK
jgi:Tfp pilus assembly protein PilZ